MAATLTADREALTYFSFPIEKTEEDPATGTVYVYGKATSPEVDTDEQVVDPEWSAKSIATWFQTGPNVRVMHNATAMPAGSGVQVEINRDGDNCHWVKAAVDEPTAKLMVLRKHLRAFSVGIAKPLIVRDVTGKARGGIIKGGELAEISLVDRPANRSCYIEIAKSASDGTCEFTGKVFGADDFITKATRDDAPVTVDLPKSATITFSPSDLAKLLEHRRIAEERQDREVQSLKALFAAEAAVYKRDIDTAARRRLRAQGRALPNLSYPLETHEDAENAVTLALSGHGNAAAAKKLIRRIARKEGWQDILDRLGGKKKEKGVTTAPDAATETLDKSGTVMPPATAVPPQVAKDDGGDPKEPVLHHDDGQDDDTDSDADANDKGAVPETAKADMPGGKPKVPCPKCKAMCKPKSRFCGNCGCPMTAQKADKPTPDGGATGAAASAITPVPEHREPDGPAIEALEHDAHLPTVPDAAVKTAMHLRSLGVPREQGMLHDLLCPAYDDTAVKAAWPGASVDLLDEMTWQAKALEVATGAPLEEAQKAVQIWTAARMLKAVTPDLHADLMAEARKAFRDANPGPGSAPAPGEMSAQRYNRPYISDGHAAPSPGHDPGHPIPVAAPEVPGVPSRVFYTNVQRQNAAQAMRAMHDHIAATFPDLCPMHGPGRMGEPPSHARPVPAGVGGPVPHGASTKSDVPVQAPLTGGESAIPPELAKKLAKKEEKRRMRELMEAVFKGDKTLNAARAELGLPPFAMPEAGTSMAVKAAGAEVAPPVAKALDADVIKAAVAEATEPLKTELAELRRVTDAIADQPDPAVTAYRGVALTKTTTAPAGPMGLSQRAELAQDNLVRELFATARNSPDPTLRTEAWEHLMTIHGITSAPVRT